ncbi:glycosyltransferase family 2 protein [Methylobacterium sp. E-066]|uniref:glycosyltransferase family 2 protein n=1 Tax=Methylobacterium sp. E-066 TaxID=2836584 RepID=UPI001FB9461E|nr:glycosyltransferase family 2 protein [Methylobacterium sp. E-066]MCJ2142952.1 glycosyltransferase [Methylobacterium sp. E-066]
MSRFSVMAAFTTRNLTMHSRDKTSWIALTLEDTNTVFIKPLARDIISRGISICELEYDLMSARIDARGIPIPEQANVGYQSLQPKVAPSRDLPTFETPERQHLAWSGKAETQGRGASLNELLQHKRPGRVILIGDDWVAEDVESLAADQDKTPPLILKSGYGSSPPMLPGLLRRPQPGTLLSWLMLNNGVEDVGLVVFSGGGDFNDEINTLHDCCHPPPTFRINAANQLSSITPVKELRLPRISIVIPSFNQANFIEETIKSIIDQNYPNLELIVIDGGSSDGTVDILNRYRKYFSVLLIEPDNGQSDALNKGFALATGDVMNWVCSDDLLEPGALHQVARAYMSTGADIIAGGCIRIGDTRQVELHRHHSAVELGKNLPLDPLDLLRFMRSWNSGAYFFQPEVFFTYRIWKLAGGYIKRHLHYAMDYDLWVRMALAGATIRHIAPMIACSRVHGLQKTQDDQKYLHQTRQIMKEYNSLFAVMFELEPLTSTETASDRSYNDEILSFTKHVNRRVEVIQTHLERLAARASETFDNIGEIELGNQITNLSSEVRDVKAQLLTQGHHAESAAGQLSMLQFWQSDNHERSILLQGRMASNAVPACLTELADAEFRVFSQWGEDGIIDWLVRSIPMPRHVFVEFGVESFKEANCRFLLQNRNWKGLVMDGSEKYMADLRNDKIYWMFDLDARPAFVTRENINELLEEAGVTGPIGVLSVDIDGNDYWVWESINCIDPAIVICEYNPILGDTQPISLPYSSNFDRFDGHHSGLYFGCSISALVSLAAKKGYSLVGTNSNGINAFFVRNDLLNHLNGKLEQITTYPSRHRDSRDENGQMAYTGGMNRIQQLADLPVVNVETGNSINIKDIVNPYSADWLRKMS